MKNYGKELVLDLHECDFGRATKKQLEVFFVDLCNQIDMQRESLYFWGYDTERSYKKAPPHLKGTSAIQFITTSNITVHTLDELKKVYINIFSCKDFSSSIAKEICLKHFGGNIINATALTRI